MQLVGWCPCDKLRFVGRLLLVLRVVLIGSLLVVMVVGALGVLD